MFVSPRKKSPGLPAACSRPIWPCSPRSPARLKICLSTAGPFAPTSRSSPRRSRWRRRSHPRGSPDNEWDCGRRAKKEQLRVKRRPRITGFWHGLNTLVCLGRPGRPGSLGPEPGVSTRHVIFDTARGLFKYSSERA